MSPDKWENACRLCSEEKNEMLPIFGDEGIQRKVAQKLRACLPVLVYKTDPLPKQICQFCAARLDDAYEFREYCLSVYKSMHLKMLASKSREDVQIFFEAMRNSPDPCQAQLCREKARAPPPLVPLPASLPLESPSMPPDVIQEPNQPACIETLTELPCEVEIKEENTEPILPNIETVPGKAMNEEINDSVKDDREQIDFQKIKEEKRTSILEQVLTGSLTMNDRKELKARTKLSSKWWCAPCNSYFKTREGLINHMQFHCPRKYTCKKCHLVFDSVENLAKHEAADHMKVTLDFEENVKECQECEREFISWKMLRQHRLRDHISNDSESNVVTWCSSCNRFFHSVESFKNHMQLHYADAQSTVSSESIISVLKTEEISKDVKREHLHEGTKSLTCPTCGKVCTQQSALSNHMRTHEPKRHKCDICGRSFGLFIRLAAHRMSEHNQQPAMTPIMATVEQEEALNAEREAREAREARTRGGRHRNYFEAIEKEDIPNNDEPPPKRSCLNANAFKNVARCGICLQWFNDHTTMLTHLQTHSDMYTCKSFNCQVCKKSFKEKWQLFRHEMSHKRNDSSNAYVCNVCNKSFVEKSVYKAHQKTHIVDKTYHCSKCNKLFFKEVSMLTHQCTGDPIFAKKNAMPNTVQHTASEKTGKKYKCNKCNASFNSSQSRNSHMRVHAESTNSTTKEEELSKELDNESMPKLRPETSLEYGSVPHIEPKVEINEESTPPPVKRTLIRTAGGYRCGVCQSPFVLRELAVAHLRSAHPVMPYQCPYCKKRFTTQYSFTHHIKTDHPDEPEK